MIWTARTFSFLAAAALTATGCSKPAPGTSTNEVRAIERFVVLSVDIGLLDGPIAVDGPIRGRLACSDTDKATLGVCMPSDLPLAEAVLSCGPVQVTVDRGFDHRAQVYFSANQHERFSSIPTDLEIVRCVQGQVGFGFRAYISDGPPGGLVEDERPFVSLRSR